ncbi:MAG: hypothetical protein ACXWC7_13940 [Chitinophagaceae bacterium]
MHKNYFVAAGFVLLSVVGFSQTIPGDTVPPSPKENLDFDTTFDYDELLDELDIFLDSLLMPRSYFLTSISAGSGYFNYVKRSNNLETMKKGVLTPTVGYYHKRGPGLSLSGNIIDDGDQLNLYQFSISPSFDFIQNHDWVSGLSYTRYFTKDSLPFYSSPLQNEFNAYVLWRKPWLQPGITASYGWGSRTEYKKQEKYIRLLRLRRRLGYVFTTNTQEDISDFSIAASIRHSFYWMHILGEKNYLKFTPQLSFSAGTQKFGFNRTTSTYPVNVRNSINLLYNTGDVSVDEKLKFQPLSLSLYLRPEYNIGKFFIQPQFILDYYIPAENLAALFSINAGIIL